MRMLRLRGLALMCCASALWAQDAASHREPAGILHRPVSQLYVAPEPASLLRSPAEDLRELLERYSADQTSLLRFHDLPMSPATDRMLRQFYGAWRAAIERIDFSRLGLEARIEYVLFRNKLDHE